MGIDKFLTGELDIGRLSFDELRIDNLSIEKVKKLIYMLPAESLEMLLSLVKVDDRKGIRSLQGSILRRLKEEKERRNKRNILLKEENKLLARGYRLIGGLDEAGRGPLAGPVVAACVVFNSGTYIEGVDDSKKLSPENRDKLFDIIMQKADAVGIGRLTPEEIDRINIMNATRLAMEQAVSLCYPNIDYLLVDAMEAQFPVPYTSLIKGDARSHSIAAASIVAKVTRDREMVKWHKKYPEYGFDGHKGYGTVSHIEVIRKIGLCPIHRRTFTQRIRGEM